jgi:hypothetical protein
MLATAAEGGLPGGSYDLPTQNRKVEARPAVLPWPGRTLLICERDCASTESLLVVAGSSLLARRGGPSWVRWSGQRAAWTTTLTPARDAAGSSSEEQLGSPQRHHLTWPWLERGPRASSLISVLGPGPATWWVIGFPHVAGAAARSMEAVHDQRGGRSIREPAAPHQRFRRPSAHDGQSCSGGGGEFGGDQRLVAEFSQGVVGLAGQLAGHRQRGPLAAQALFDLEVIAVVRRARAGGAHGCFV